MNIYTAMGDILGPCYFCSIYFCEAVLSWFIMESQMEETQPSWHILNTLKLISVFGFKFFSIKIFNSCEFHTVHILQEKMYAYRSKGCKIQEEKSQRFCNTYNIQCRLLILFKLWSLCHPTFYIHNYIYNTIGMKMYFLN